MSKLKTRRSEFNKVVSIMIVKMFSAIVIMAAITIECQSGQPTVDEVLSTYFSRIEMAGTTNVSFRTCEWGGPCLARLNGSEETKRIEHGGEMIISCGNSCTISHGGKGACIRVEVCCAHNMLNGKFPVIEKEDLVIRVRGSLVDMAFVPSKGLTYDYMTGTFVKCSFPYRSIWKDEMSQMKHYSRKRHMEFSRRAVSFAMNLYTNVNAHVSEHVKRHQCEFLNVEALSVLREGESAIVRFDAARKVDAVKIIDGVRKCRACAYSAEGCCKWYFESFRDGAKQQTVLICYDQHGDPLKSWHSNFHFQFLVDIEKGGVFNTRPQDIKQFLQEGSCALGNFKKD